jgi:hypothetical protein
VITLVLGALAAPAHAATLEPIGAYSSPMYVTSDPADPNRLLVAERAGTVRMTTADGTSTYLTIPQPITQDGEHGLFSIAFPGDFASTRLFYVAYGRAESPSGYSLVLDEYAVTGDAMAICTGRSATPAMARTRRTSRACSARC